MYSKNSSNHPFNLPVSQDDGRALAQPELALLKNRLLNCSGMFSASLSALAVFMVLASVPLVASAEDQAFSSGSPNAFQFGQQDMQSLQFSRKEENQASSS